MKTSTPKLRSFSRATTNTAESDSAATAAGSGVGGAGRDDDMDTKTGGVVVRPAILGRVSLVVHLIHVVPQQLHLLCTHSRLIN